jgi:hypothetical protein
MNNKEGAKPIPKKFGCWEYDANYKEWSNGDGMCVKKDEAPRSNPIEENYGVYVFEVDDGGQAPFIKEEIDDLSELLGENPELEPPEGYEEMINNRTTAYIATRKFFEAIESAADFNQRGRLAWPKEIDGVQHDSWLLRAITKLLDEAENRGYQKGLKSLQSEDKK